MNRKLFIISLIVVALLVGGAYLILYNKRQRLVSIVKRDLKKYGGIPETDPRMQEFIIAAWQSVNWNVDKDNIAEYDNEFPWSAATISYWMQESGARDFPKHAAHAIYVVEARKNRELGKKAGQGKIELYRLHEHRPRVGDLLVSWRKREVSFDTVQVGDTLHVDVIIEIHNDHIVVVGGNVSNTIKSREFALDINGYIIPENHAFAIIKNEYLI